MKIDEAKLKAISNVMFQRFNLGDPETASIRQAIKAMILQEFSPLIILGCNTLGPREMIEILRTFADGLELVMKEEEKNDKTD